MNRSNSDVVFTPRGGGFGVWPGIGRRCGTFVRALWLVERYGTAEAADPANDQRVKRVIFKAVGKGGELDLSEVGGFMEAETFNKLAGPDGRVGAGGKSSTAVEAAVPESRLPAAV